MSALAVLFWEDGDGAERKALLDTHHTPDALPPHTWLASAAGGDASPTRRGAAATDVGVIRAAEVGEDMLECL